MHFAGTWNHLQKHCVSAEFLLVEGYLQDALRKELRIVSFAERFKQLLWEGLTDEFCQYLELAEALVSFRIFADRKLFTRCSTKGAVHCSFCRAL